ncbi:UbiA-like protein EboC [Crenalkalicoccus roseus]|uniref:UbiA-like protein EboC n=1 Tax=Crenalkalicoccus roseus TaxID=1485588 RepID=UPI001080E31E|nr:UbiA-like protein EboC [Crenalkalicoccus roseus]
MDLPAAPLPRRVRARAYLALTRPANVVTALADILAGFAAAGAAAPWGALPWLLLATACLYAGGVVLNDVFDAALDARERPERPIPSGRASRRGAALLGAGLLAGGTLAAFQASAASGALALGIVLAVLLYDGWAKHRPLLGPATMGLCRGLNLLLGVSAAPAALGGLWLLALLPLAYIAAITAVSRGEVHGGRRGTGWLAMALLGLVLAALLGLGLRPDYVALAALPFAALLAWRVLPPFLAAAREPAPARIGAAVKAGVLSLIVLDAALAAGFAGPLYGIAVLALLPVSLVLARAFAVT